ncbi:C-terminal processing protease CtpA/Prc, contains a PDZ domain [Polaribacter sp. KT25b]|uniref:S41 family peptidase n=1 Tax=Polaribacter sp. KT25b TaxID=1855336 RepID=UPI00087BE1E3|nr:S41 family peptidase [Polaribacter sp. KT25b]SDR98246.1 C-terminal processing protease CtpA/Prc, contains a PDZ domain [Polaribacter sp. KT25b]
MNTYFTINKTLIICILSIVTLFSSCEKEKAYSIETTINDDINYFIWEGLNNYYLWQKDVPNLSDDKFSNLNDLYINFKGYSSPEAVFESLLNRPEDRFSWIVNDYVALENSFQGINLSNGMEFGLVEYKNNSNKIFGYVRYVIENSDAATNGISRGMIFNYINDSQLTYDNYEALLFSNTTNYTVGFANYNDGNPIFNNNTISLSKVELQENPVAIIKVFTEGSNKIGYLLYNQFASNYDGQLNAVFANLKSENITELIIDLRYNGGGSVSTATYLGSMVTGQFNGELYSQEVWNDKVMKKYSSDGFLNNFTNKIRNTDENGTVILEESINSLHLNKVYFITSYSTASASELVINSLSSYIDVELVGKTTRGKQVGSITIYDSDNSQRNGSNLNPNHTYAMQPLVLEISNKDNQNYPEGIIPGKTLSGIELGEDYNNLGVLGERSDPLLNKTIEYITTDSKTSTKTKNLFEFNEFFNSKLATPAKDNMFINLNK